MMNFRLDCASPRKVLNFRCMYMHYVLGMGTTTISLSDEPYRVLKAQKREREGERIFFRPHTTQVWQRQPRGDSCISEGKRAKRETGRSHRESKRRSAKKPSLHTHSMKSDTIGDRDLFITSVTLPTSRSLSQRTGSILNACLAYRRKAGSNESRACPRIEISATTVPLCLLDPSLRQQTQDRG